MTDNTPHKIHTVTASHIGRWAASVTGGEKVAQHRVADGEVKHIGPRGVGYQRDYWGPDPALAAETEAKFHHAETTVVPVLRDLRAAWPLTGNNRGVLAEFMAIHIVRMPSFVGHLRKLGEAANRATIAEGAPKHGLDEAQAAIYSELLRSDRIHVDGLLRQVVRAGTALGSMHWTLVEFAEDWLITGDQPLVMLGAPPHRVSPASAIGPFTLDAVEARFTLDPRHVLLMTWLDAPEDQTWLHGERTHAAAINCAVKQQALEEWFSKPGMTPPFIAGQVEGHGLPVLEEQTSLISESLLPGYTVEHAAASKRRQDTTDILGKLIENQATNEMIFVTVNHKKHAA
jgi:hypothetical protein